MKKYQISLEKLELIKRLNLIKFIKCREENTWLVKDIFSNLSFKVLFKDSQSLSIFDDFGWSEKKCLNFLEASKQKIKRKVFLKEEKIVQGLNLGIEQISNKSELNKSSDKQAISLKIKELEKNIFKVKEQLIYKEKLERNDLLKNLFKNELILLQNINRNLRSLLLINKKMFQL